MNNLKKSLLLLSFALISSACSGNPSVKPSEYPSESPVTPSENPSFESPSESSFDSSSEIISEAETSEGRDYDNMTKVEKEFYNFVDGNVDFPTSFVYDGIFYKGFKKFNLISKTETEDPKSFKKSVLLRFKHPDGKLTIEVDAAVYKEYDAYDWTVYFINESNSNTGVISDVSGADMYFKGANPVFKGNYGDYGGYFEPFSKNLLEENVELISNTGRDSEVYLPYYNIETDDGGAMMALGWPGTWSAKFENTQNGVHYEGTGTLGLNLYLKPGEKVRTPLMAFVRYFERDYDKATNKWRKWVIDCNYPYEDAKETHRFTEGQTCVFFACDTGKGWYTGGSEFESYKTYEKSIQACVSHGLTFDYHHFDAGWYYDVNGRSIGDSWYSVGSWMINEEKWPSSTFKRYTNSCKNNLDVKGTLVWFEVERVNGYAGDWAKTTGGDPDWLIPNDGSNLLFNLGNKDAVDFIFNVITNVMDKCAIDVYREDHNFSPNSAFKQGDAIDGRSGITENLHFQGKFDLWDRIIKWQKQNNKAGFIEMQSSGGNRQCLELLRRSVSFYRSDSDITLDPAFTVSKVTNLNKWIPFGGTLFSRVSETTEANPRDMFQWRSGYSSLVSVAMPFQTLTDATWKVIEDGMKEYQTYKKFVLKDMYELTPTKKNHSEKDWVAREYLDSETQSGVLEAFRFKECEDESLVIKLKGLDENKMYSLTDPDGLNGVARISGKQLMENGHEVFLSKRSSSILWINEVK